MNSNITLTNAMIELSRGLGAHNTAQGAFLQGRLGLFRAPRCGW